MRSAFAPVVPALVALIASLVRWQLQGSGNFYTAVKKQFWVQHPDLGWIVSDRHPIWLGLEIIGAIAAIAGALVIGGFVIRRRERKTKRTSKILRVAAWVAGVSTLGIPAGAFLTGWAPAGARDLRPVERAGTTAIEGIAGSLPLPAGTYAVVPHPQGSVITAAVKGGGESFTAVFRDAKGELAFDPTNLAKPITGTASVSATSVDTGISARSTSARDYLQANRHPRIAFRFGRLIAAAQESPDVVRYRAAGTIELAGKTHDVDVTGTLKRPDAAALSRLGVTGNVLLVQADFSIVIKETVLAADASDFNTDTIPIHVSLVLRHTGGGSM